MTLPAAHTFNYMYNYRNRPRQRAVYFCLRRFFNTNVFRKNNYLCSFLMNVCTNVVKKHFECDTRLKVNFIS